VAYKENTDHVAAVVKEVAAELRRDPAYAPVILDDLEVLGVDQFADSAVIVKVRIKTMPIKQWAVGRELRRRIKFAFDAKGIEIPFPHLSVYVGEATKPFAVQVKDSRQATDGNQQGEPARVIPASAGPSAPPEGQGSSRKKTGR
ncbi:MAG: mechanosensitive ion channel family protein, partial [Candidatus Acidiferrales bacterium]